MTFISKNKAGILCLLVLLSLPLIPASAQTRALDSLNTLLSKSQGAERLRLLNLTGDEMRAIDSERSKKYFEEALKLSDKLGDKGQYAWALTGLAALKMNQIDREEGDKMNEEAMKIAESLGDQVLVSRVLSARATRYWLTGDYSKSIEYGLQALKLSEKTGDIQGMARAAHRIGLAYQTMGKIEDAEAYTLKSIEYSKKGNYHFALVNSYHTLANLYGMTGRYDKAIAMDKLGLELCRDAGNLRTQSQFLVNMGTCYMYIKDYAASLDHFNKALVIDKQYNDIKNIGDIYYTIANVYFEKKETDKAISYLDSSMPYFSSVKYRYGERSAHELYASCFEIKGNYKQALEHQKAYTALTDTIYNQETARSLAEMKTRYETEKKEQELEQEKQNSRIKMLIVVAAAIIILLVFFLYYQRYKTKQKLLLEKSVKASEEKERTRISQDLHDHVGAQLTYLVSNMDWLAGKAEAGFTDYNRMQAISDMAKQSILTLRETVWALNTETITTEAFADKFKVFVNKMVEFNPGLSVSFSENLKGDRMIKPNIALNLYRICQEAFSNALKHSKAGHISIEFTENEAGDFMFSISDDGVGFDTSRRKNGHYGLHNMMSRAAEIGAECLVSSDEGAGTTVSLRLAASKIKNTTNAV